MIWDGSDRSLVDSGFLGYSTFDLVNNDMLFYDLGWFLIAFGSTAISLGHSEVIDNVIAYPSYRLITSVIWQVLWAISRITHCVLLHSVVVAPFYNHFELFPYFIEMRVPP
jgi:hypothetical protein